MAGPAEEPSIAAILEGLLLQQEARLTASLQRELQRLLSELEGRLAEQSSPRAETKRKDRSGSSASCGEVHRAASEAAQGGWWRRLLPSESHVSGMQRVEELVSNELLASLAPRPPKTSREYGVVPLPSVGEVPQQGISFSSFRLDSLTDKWPVGEAGCEESSEKDYPTAATIEELRNAVSGTPLGGAAAEVPLGPQGSLLNMHSPLLLRACAILDWGKPALDRIYRPVVCTSAALFVVGVGLLFGACQRHATLQAGCESGDCLQFEVLTDLLLALGSVLGLVAMRSNLRLFNLLGDNSCLLMAYCQRQEVLDSWCRGSRCQGLLLFSLWGSAVALRLVSARQLPLLQAASGLAFVPVSLLFMGVSFCALHVNCAASCLVDSYCSKLHEYTDIATGVREWNMMQALLRKVSRSIEAAFLVLQTTAFATIFLSAFSVLLQGVADSWWPLSQTILALSMGLNFFKAAEVTEKCSRVPALVNSLCFEDDIDLERHYLVQYVSHSKAGFYIWDLRLTAAMALKLTYVCGLVAFGVLTRLTSIL